MVQINLLPQAERKKRQVKAELNIRLKPLVFILIGVMVAIILTWTKLGMDLTAKRKQLSRLDGNLKSVKSTLQKLEELKAEKEQLMRRLEFIQQQLQRQVYWAEDLNRLSNLVPAGIWLKSLVLHSEKQGHLDKYTKLDIDGSAISLGGKEMINLISGFMTALEQDEVLSKQFSEIKLVSSQRSKAGNIEIMYFKLFCQFR